jgi:hypothetical protein
MRERVGPHHYGMEPHETGEQKAEQLVRSGLKQLHWTEADLETRPKSDKSKVKLAQRVRKETIPAETNGGLRLPANHQTADRGGGKVRAPFQGFWFFGVLQTQGGALGFRRAPRWGFGATKD